jgi:hypothetical protein
MVHECVGASQVTHRPVPPHLGHTVIRPHEEVARLARRYRDSDDLASWHPAHNA